MMLSPSEVGLTHVWVMSCARRTQQGMRHSGCHPFLPAGEPQVYTIKMTRLNHVLHNQRLVLMLQMAQLILLHACMQAVDDLQRHCISAAV